jgi:selenide,water dikinase
VADDPYVFGQIAAANSLSDAWAMGGRAVTVLNLLGYPDKKLDTRSASRILRGMGDKVKEAGAVVCGGHTWVDPEIRAGLAVTGTVHPDRIVTNAGAHDGDVLILTKPIGTGIFAFAATKGAAAPSQWRSVVESMTALNRTAAEAMIEAGVRACTDVTGFSLIGHAAEMADASGVSLEMSAAKIPVFEGALDLAVEAHVLPLGLKNRSAFERSVRFDPSVTEVFKRVLFDPQTSGGLLIAAKAGRAQSLLRTLHAKGVRNARIIGRVIPKGGKRILILK